MLAPSLLPSSFLKVRIPNYLIIHSLSAGILHELFTCTMAAESQPGDRPRPGAIFVGCAIVGAAAGYALLALRFKNLNASDRGRFAAGSAEMRAAESITRTYFSSRFMGGSARRAQARAFFPSDASARTKGDESRNERCRLCLGRH